MSVSLGCIPLDPPVFLAPTAGITDEPAREVALGFGAGLVISEIAAGGEVLRAGPAGAPAPAGMAA